MDAAMEEAARIAQLTRSRIAYKGSVTKRINTLNRLIAEGGSRTKIRYLRTALLEAYQAEMGICEELKRLSHDGDSQWIVDEKERIDNILIEILDYLEARKDDVSSKSSDIEDWLKGNDNKVPINEQVNGMSELLDTMEINEYQNIPSSANQVTHEPIYESTTSIQQRYESQCLNNRPGITFIEPSYDDVMNTSQTHVSQSLNDRPRFHTQPSSVRNQSSDIYVDPSLGPARFGSVNNEMLREIQPVRNQVTSRTENMGVDSWIDRLDQNHDETMRNGELPPDRAISALLTQQCLPRLSVPMFDGSSRNWIDFVTKFHDLVHSELYLTGIRKCALLFQHLQGEAKRSIAGVQCNWRGYVISLQRLKKLFGESTKVVLAVVQKITHGPTIRVEDRKALGQYFYDVSDCIVALKQLNCMSDLHSHEVLCLAVRRLPKAMQYRWAEHTSRLKTQNVVPNLISFEKWLEEKVITLREANNYMDYGQFENKRNVKTEFNGFVSNDITCSLCSKGKHHLSKCEMCQELDANSRFQRVKELRLCFACLKGKHGIRMCKSKYTCFVKGCNERHQTSLHEYYTQKLLERSKSENKSNSSSNSDANKDKFNGVLDESTTEIYLQIVPVVLKAPNGKKMPTYALLDAGSHVTLVRDDIARKLNLNGKPRNINIGTIKDKPAKVSVREIKLSVQSKDGNCNVEVKNAYAMPKSEFKMPSQPCPANYNNPDIYTHLDGIDLEPVDKNKIGILIGANVPEALIVNEVRKGRDNQPLAVKTIFGWSLFGAANTGHELDVTVSLLHTQKDVVSPLVESLWRNGKPDEPIVEKKDDFLSKQVESFWIQENYAISKETNMEISVEDSVALKKLESETKFIDGRYQVPMLWKESMNKLPNNIEVAKRRFKFLQKRLRNNPILYESFKKVLEGYITLGYARKLSPQEASTFNERTWYLPIHPVFNIHKPDKVRIVNDAAAMYEGVSLNSSLVTGPDLLNSLVGVLLNFRIGEVAVVGDIEAMFHQVRVDPMDADSLRFLWADDIHSDEVYTMQMLVHIFGAKDSLACAIYALHQTARDNINKFTPEVIQTVFKSFYVDDLLKSVKSVETAKRLVNELTDLLKLGGFRLTKWISNSSEVLKSIPATEIAKDLSINLDKSNDQRALGIAWNVASDCFTFNLEVKNAASTKRGILKVTSSIFDPLGFITPFVLRAKIILQELWRKNYGWDDKINDDILKPWRDWLINAEELSFMKLDRCYMQNGDSDVVKIELHIFCDASELAFGSVAYLRYCFLDGTFCTSFVMSKSKLAPIKTVSLPRLELCSAVTAVRLYSAIKKVLDLVIDQVYFWTDSMLTFQYISNESHRFKVFVANRVSEILEASNKSQWRHIPGKLNPADLVTRGVIKPNRLMERDKQGTYWFHGPEFLSRKEGWPNTVCEKWDESNLEIKTKGVLLTCNASQQSTQVIDTNRFSSWIKLHRSVAWMMRFINNARIKVKQEGQLICEEMKLARIVLVKLIQREAFGNELSILENKGEISCSVLTSLSPFVDDMGMMRVGGRLRRMQVTDETKYPIILPKVHNVTDLIVFHEHKRNGHIGAEHTLSELRQNFWILHGRTVVKRVIRKCFFCKMKKAKFMYPFMADLPVGRTASSKPPFTHSGTDLFGPVFIKQGRKRLKRWVVLFTCLTVRCVHLEVVENADTDAFINALRRFINRRGCPDVIYSDNGTNFKGASNELKEFIDGLDHKKVEQFCTNVSINWKFNPPASPHMGGIWERIIRSTKEVLSGLMSDNILNDAQFYTLLTEVESILNNRPLTHISDDPEDLEPLTPNHLLLGLHKNWPFVASVEEKEVSSRRQWRQVQAISRLFWDRWTKEYVPTIIKRHKWQKRLNEVFTVGELVLLIDEEIKKKSWLLGRIVELMASDDGIVRVVKVRTKNGVYTRPVTKIGKLEEDSLRQRGEC